MSAATLIIVARILHIVSSTIWAGFVMVAGLVLVNSQRDMSAEEARRRPRSTVSRAARVVVPAASVSFLSGLYLFSARHAGSRSLTEVALGIGAFSTVLSFFVGAVGSGVPERQLEKLDARSALSPSESTRFAALNRRVVLSGRATAGLRLISGSAMAIARDL
ncbi:MAG: hypothetical protein ACREQD_14635 [Candidatus Binataceae bacterium]